MGGWPGGAEVTLKAKDVARAQLVQEADIEAPLDVQVVHAAVLSAKRGHKALTATGVIPAKARARQKAYPGSQRCHGGPACVGSRC